MKGIIFNITENYITENYGEDKLDEIIADCSLITKEPFVGPGTYPDDDLIEIITKASLKLEMTNAQFLKKLGHYTFPILASRFPNFVTPYNHPKEFLKTVESIIHVEVRKLYQGTRLPTFQYAEPANNELVITYHSKRKLYSFMEGLIDGVADHFNTPIEQSHKIYGKDGSEYCDFHIIFAK